MAVQMHLGQLFPHLLAVGPSTGCRTQRFNILGIRCHTCPVWVGILDRWGPLQQSLWAGPANMRSGFGVSSAELSAGRDGATARVGRILWLYALSKCSVDYFRNQINHDSMPNSIFIPQPGTQYFQCQVQNHFTGKKERPFWPQHS